MDYEPVAGTNPIRFRCLQCLYESAYERNVRDHVLSRHQGRRVTIQRRSAFNNVLGEVEYGHLNLTFPDWLTSYRVILRNELTAQHSCRPHRGEPSLEEKEEEGEQKEEGGE